MSIPLVSLFQFMLFFLCALLAAFVVSQNKPLALAGLFSAVGLHAGFIGLENYYGMECFNHASALILVYGPLLYLTVTEVLQRRSSLVKSNAWHLLPYIITLFGWSLSFFNDAIIISLGALSLTLYIGLSFYCLRRFRLVMTHTQSSALPSAFNWLKTTVYLISVTYVFMSIRLILSFYIDKAIISQIDFAFFIIASGWFAHLVFQGLGSPEFIPSIDEEDGELVNHITSNAARIQNHHHQSIVKKIDYCMHEHKPYVDAQITVKDFAALLGVPARQLSEVINDQYGMSFSEFINRARVLETQRLMTASGWSEKSLLDIALAAGFNSKSSFNLMFKRITQMTPSAYRKQLQFIAEKPKHFDEQTAA